MASKGLDLFLMNVLPNVYICLLRKKSAPTLPEGAVKRTHQIHREDHLKLKDGAVVRVRILVEQVIL